MILNGLPPPIPFNPTRQQEKQGNPSATGLPKRTPGQRAGHSADPGPALRSPGQSPPRAPGARQRALGGGDVHREPKVRELQRLPIRTPVEGVLSLDYSLFILIFFWGGSFSWRRSFLGEKTNQAVVFWRTPQILLSMELVQRGATRKTSSSLANQARNRSRTSNWMFLKKETELLPFASLPKGDQVEKLPNQRWTPDGIRDCQRVNAKSNSNPNHYLQRGISVWVDRTQGTWTLRRTQKPLFVLSFWGTICELDWKLKNH